MDSGNRSRLQFSSGGDRNHTSRIKANHFSHHTSRDGGNSLLNSATSPSHPQTQSRRRQLFAGSCSSENDSFPPSLAANEGHKHSDPPPFAKGDTNRRKRPRASRRAPTTVLTTDPSNFRAMVQEFTGVQPPPFTSKLHLMGSSVSVVRSSSSHIDSLFTRTHRPIAQKFIPLPYFGISDHSSSSSLFHLGMSCDQVSGVQKHTKSQMLSIQPILASDRQLEHFMSTSPLPSLENNLWKVDGNAAETSSDLLHYGEML